jgi:hypothetical protein
MKRRRVSDSISGVGLLWNPYNKHRLSIPKFYAVMDRLGTAQEHPPCGIQRHTLMVDGMNLAKQNLVRRRGSVHA